jgi:hypothetical protein
MFVSTTIGGGEASGHSSIFGSTATDPRPNRPIDLLRKILSACLAQFAATAKGLQFQIVQEPRNFSLVQHAAAQAHDNVSVLDLDPIRGLSGHFGSSTDDDRHPAPIYHEREPKCQIMKWCSPPHSELRARSLARVMETAAYTQVFQGAALMKRTAGSRAEAVLEALACFQPGIAVDGS